MSWEEDDDDVVEHTDHYCYACDYDHALPREARFCPMCGEALPPPEPQQTALTLEWDPPREPGPGFNLSQVDAIFREAYLPGVVAMLNTSNSLLDILNRPERRTWEQQPWVFSLEGESQEALEKGKSFTWNTHVGRNMTLTQP
jgi:hypothetical protein